MTAFTTSFEQTTRKEIAKINVKQVVVIFVDKIFS